MYPCIYLSIVTCYRLLELVQWTKGEINCNLNEALFVGARHIFIYIYTWLLGMALGLWPVSIVWLGLQPAALWLGLRPAAPLCNVCIY